MRGAVILVFAVLFRVTLLFSPPTLSDDLYRYVWDGRTQNHGINPYRYPPNAPELAGLRDAYYPGINNKPIPTVYPPLMEIVFRGVDRIAHTPMAMKVVFVLCDLGVIVLLGLLLRTHHLPIVRMVIYAWNPLVLVEVAGSGHNDPLAVGLMLAALLALTAGRPILSVVSLALSVVSKLFAVVLLPSVARAMPRKRALLLFPVVVGLLYLPYLDAGRHLTTGLFVYGNKWRFNDSLFTLALSVTGDLTLAKVIVGVFFLGVVITRLRGPESPVRTAYVLIGAYLILTPTVQSWYLLWLLPFLCFFPNRAWLLLSGLIMLSYHVLIQFTRTGLWREALWVRYVEYIPFYALLMFDAIKGRKG
ncbi:MAG: hypothetical protein HY710_12560 [Candidatus Latescibacteria bacterium]|nr:hypothetical protein [Candidatus Latescibacterota bacterium]